MRKYPKYKASGVDWLGEIPSDWQCMKIKRLTVVKRGASPRPIDDSKYFDENGEFAWVRIADVTASERYLENTTQRLSKLGSSLSVKRYPGDLFLSIAATVGKPIITKVKCCIHDGFVWFPYLKTNPEFLYFLFSTGLPYQGLGKMGTQLNLNTDTVGDINLPIPPDEEIFSIVQFLDHKTDQIGRFIANRQKQIELLKEQKAAIINRAVTKGINPNAKMKDSGIEWIGEVPEHWMIGKVRRGLNILTDFTANGSFADLAKNVKYLDTPDYSRLIRLTDLREDLKNEGIYVNKEAHKFLAKSELFGGEILMANVGAFAGLVCLVPKLDFVATLGPNMFLLKFDDKRMSNQFAFTLLSSDCYYKLLMNKALSSAQPKLNKEDVKSIDFIFPPTHEEQDAIIEFIKEETSNVDTLITKYQKQIDLMQEYRTVLISQAVTGKIDVRDWKPKKQKTS